MGRLRKKHYNKMKDLMMLRSGEIRCNICRTPFHPHTHYERFCSSCRKSSRVFKMSEWLPEHTIAF